MIIKKDWNEEDQMDLTFHVKPILESTERIICSSCGKQHVPHERTFLTFYGNVTLGLTGGLVGNHFSKDGKLARVTFLCRSIKCLPASFLL